ncbi:family 16 glycosylhydrolase [uncultured Jannaschia sp.]|uniref:family 16 glycosylhydrolase n=1 Tax=uncultured Jannaschia sp. TaxID=293347 RepID=UPI002617D0D0|nr:family 16 glycosylhydrolase [uncultured Jannaschia sp.]
MRVFAALIMGTVWGSSAMGQGFSDTFDKSETGEWHVAEYDFDHPMFDTDWMADHAKIDDGLTLILSPQTDKANGFAGGSIRRNEATHWGRYSAVIRPAAGEGIITGFFTYSGPAYGTRHDEIDIEFLGRDTRSVHAAWFVDGVLRARTVPLGFDASDGARLYAFDWLPDRIRWYAEDRLILEITEADGPLPEIPGMLFANLWAADHSIASWSGKTVPRMQAQAAVHCMSFAPWTGDGFAEPDATCVPSDETAAARPITASATVPDDLTRN